MEKAELEILLSIAVDVYLFNSVSIEKINQKSLVEKNIAFVCMIWAFFELLYGGCC